jgi:hypothetical protein
MTTRKQIILLIVIFLYLFFCAGFLCIAMNFPVTTNSALLISMFFSVLCFCGVWVFLEKILN